jgi:D-sedoheptulose 7-phosphate isomerase
LKYFNDLISILNDSIVTNFEETNISIEKGISEMKNLLLNIDSNKVIVIGNGGSAAIASHVANDLCKSDNIKAICFSDYSYNTCMANDFGYEYVYQKGIDMFANKGDILIAISSSGNSENIIRAANKGREKGCAIVTFSGFKSNNKLRNLGDINIYVPKEHYGHVELCHQIILHMVTDTIGESKNINE